MILPHLLHLALPLILTGAIGCPLALVPFFVLANLDRPALVRLQVCMLLVVPGYPVLCWALFTWAGHHDHQIEERLRASGAVASATVMAVQDLGIDLNQNPRLELRLRVAPADAEPFDAEVFTSASRLSMGNYAQAASVRVRYDPRQRSHLMLDE